jgi:hypothetical protein
MRRKREAQLNKTFAVKYACIGSQLVMLSAFHRWIEPSSPSRAQLLIPCELEGGRAVWTFIYLPKKRSALYARVMGRNPHVAQELSELWFVDGPTRPVCQYFTRKPAHVRGNREQAQAIDAGARKDACCCHLPCRRVGRQRMLHRKYRSHHHHR